MTIWKRWNVVPCFCFTAKILYWTLKYNCFARCIKDLQCSLLPSSWPWWRVNVYGATNIFPWTRQRTMSNAVESWTLNAPDVMQPLKGQTKTPIMMSVWWRTFNVNVGFYWKGQTWTNTEETCTPYKKSFVHSNVEKQLRGLFSYYTLD